MEKLSNLRIELESELEELTASLFQVNFTIYFIFILLFYPTWTSIHSALSKLYNLDPFWNTFCLIFNEMQEAHAMVLEANIKQRNAEKKFEETNSKVTEWRKLYSTVLIARAYA